MLSSFNLIKTELDALEAYLRRAVETPLPLISSIGQRLVVSGGKRLRPALFLLAARCAGNNAVAAADEADEKGAAKKRDLIPLAAALEMVHMASLMHDDVIDGAEQRRGQPTANAEHGNHVAVLAGDYLFAHAFHLLSDTEYPKAVAVRLAELIKELAAGEIAQDSRLYSTAISEETYYGQIEKKTALFFAVCAEIGAICADAPEAMSLALRDYGYNLGLAFQITDDVLDFSGDGATIGKAVGSDLRQGVVTLPAIYALANSPAKARLAAIAANPQMGAAELAEAIAIIKESGGIEYALAEAKKFIAKAKAVIPPGSEADAAKALGELADYVGQRDF